MVSGVQGGLTEGWQESIVREHRMSEYGGKGGWVWRVGYHEVAAVKWLWGERVDEGCWGMHWLCEGVMLWVGGAAHLLRLQVHSLIGNLIRYTIFFFFRF